MALELNLGLGLSRRGGFSPAQISDLALWLDAKDATTIITDGAAQFTAGNNEALSRSDQADLRHDVGDFSYAGWVYFDNTGTLGDFVGKWTALNNSEFVLRRSAASILQLFYTTDGSSITALTTTTSLSASNWYFICARYDSAEEKMYARADTTEQIFTGVLQPIGGTNDFILGAKSPGGSGAIAGRMDSWARFNRFLSDAEVSALYNSGAGRTYLDLDAISFDKTNLIAWWDLDEVSGTRFDSHGSNDLTDNRTVSSATGIVSGQASDGDPISQWSDKSGNGNDVTQTTAGTKPTLDIDGFNSKRTLDLDGTQFMSMSDYTTGTSVTLFIVARSEAATGASRSLIAFDATNDFQLYAGDTDFNFIAVATDHTAFSYDGEDHTDENNIYGYRLDADNNTAKTYINGVESANSVSNYNTDLDTTQTLLIGTNRNTVQQITGVISEVIIYDRALSDAERTKVEDYLATKWEVTL